MESNNIFLRSYHKVYLQRKTQNTIDDTRKQRHVALGIRHYNSSVIPRLIPFFQTD